MFLQEIYAPKIALITSKPLQMMSILFEVILTRIHRGLNRKLSVLDSSKQEFAMVINWFHGATLMVNFIPYDINNLIKSNCVQNSNNKISYLRYSSSSVSCFPRSYKRLLPLIFKLRHSHLQNNLCLQNNSFVAIQTTKPIYLSFY